MKLNDNLVILILNINECKTMKNLIKKKMFEIKLILKNKKVLTHLKI